MEEERVRSMHTHMESSQQNSFCPDAASRRCFPAACHIRTAWEGTRPPGNRQERLTCMIKRSHSTCFNEVQLLLIKWGNALKIKRQWFSRFTVCLIYVSLCPDSRQTIHGTEDEEEEEREPKIMSPSPQSNISTDRRRGESDLGKLSRKLSSKRKLLM